MCNMCNCSRNNFCIDETTLLIILVVLFFVCGWGNCSGIYGNNNCGYDNCGNNCGC